MTDDGTYGTGTSFDGSESIYEIHDYGSPKEVVHYWADYQFDILCGAVVNWIYSGRFNEWSLHILYWKNRTLQKISRLFSPYLKRSRFYFSGFCSMNRGRHWDRKRR